EPVHLLRAFLSDGTSIAVSMLNKLGADLPRLQESLDDALEKLPVVTGASVSGQYAAQELKKVFDRALAEAELLKDEYVSSEHLLIALSESADRAGTALRSQEVTKDKLLGVLQDVRGTQRASDQHAESRYQALKRYARD